MIEQHASKVEFVEDAMRSLRGDSSVEEPSAMVLLIIGPSTASRRNGLLVDMSVWGDGEHLWAVMKDAGQVVAMMLDGAEAEMRR